MEISDESSVEQTRRALRVTALGLGVVGAVGWVIHRRLTKGPHSNRAEFERRAVAELGRQRSTGVVTEADLDGLQITVDTREIERAVYAKHPAGTLTPVAAMR